MPTHIQHYVHATDRLEVSESTDAVWIGAHVMVGVHDSDAAHVLAQQFLRLAERMRRDAKLPEPVEAH